MRAPIVNICCSPPSLAPTLRRDNNITHKLTKAYQADRVAPVFKDARRL
jgi:hypothetical protein